MKNKKINQLIANLEQDLYIAEAPLQSHHMAGCQHRS